jgi:hypothetical protein
MKKTFISMPAIKKKQITQLWRRNNDNLWMYPFSENGGLVPDNGKTLIQDFQRFLVDPNYGENNADQFIQNRIHRPDVNTCQRILSDVKTWIND